MPLESVSHSDFRCEYLEIDNIPVLPLRCEVCKKEWMPDTSDRKFSSVCDECLWNYIMLGSIQERLFPI